MAGVMDGIRILEVAEHTFVPAASAILFGLGRRGDQGRADRTGRRHARPGPHRGDGPGRRHGARPAGALQPGQASIALDLTTAGGRDVLYRLATMSDVFLTNKLPRIRTELGIDVADITAHNPEIIYVRGSGFGPTGPDADHGGYDVLGFWCRSAVAAGACPPDLDHLMMQPAPAFGDSIGAMTIAGGIAGALLRRERTGAAAEVDVSLLAAGMWANGAGIALALQMGQPWTPQPLAGGTVHNPLSHSYRTEDGEHVFLGCLQAFRYWPDLCRVIGRPDLIDDPRFATHDDLTSNADQAVALLTLEFATRPRAEWMARLDAFSGQWSVVNDSLSVVDDPQVAPNGYLVDTEAADGTPFSLVATPVQYDGAPSPTARAPGFNEHGDRILSDLLGMGWDEIIDLKTRGAVG